MHQKMVSLAQTVPEGRVFGLDGQTLISVGIQLLNGIILAVVLGYLFYKPVKEFMRKRSERIQGQMEDADATMAKANELIAVYEEKIKGIEAEQLEILEAARLKAAEQSKHMLQQAKQEADKLKQQSLERIAADRTRLKEEMRLYVIEVASLIAERYITEKIGSEDQDRLFEHALTQLEGTKWES